MAVAGPSSNHAATAQRITNAIKDLPTIKENEYVTPPDTDESFRELKETLEITGATPVSTKSILKVNKSYHFNEKRFDDTLFEALKNDLNQSGIKWKSIKESEQKNFLFQKVKRDIWIILEGDHLRHEDFFIGFAQQAELKPTKYEGSPGRTTIVLANAKPGHTCCIFKRSNPRIGKNGELKYDWNVEGIFSAVELKISDKSSSCGETFLRDIRSRETDETKADPIVQVISYVFDFVWPTICRFGLQLSDSGLDSMTFALIAAQKFKTKSTKHRWVRGRLEPPQTWGEQFAVQNTGSEAFGDKDSATNAANSYVEVMLQGIKLAKMAIDALKTSSPIFPYPLAGRPPGLDKNSYIFCGSPLLLRKDLEQQYEGEVNNLNQFVTQGELFYFPRLNLRDLKFRKWNEHRWLVNEPIVENVLVKVWQNGIHRSLQDHGKYSEAYDSILFSELKGILSRDFMGMTLKGGTTVTVMRYIQGHAVEPKNNDVSWYWKLFRELCTEILVPLAAETLIHQDLRPGYDCTYNILIEVTGNTTKMKIIDYESLCQVADYRRADSRYPCDPLDKEDGTAACNIVFQQCIGMVYAWTEQIPAKDFDFDDAVAWWGSVVEGNDAAEENKKGIDKKDIAFQWWKNRMDGGIEIAFKQLFSKINELVDEVVPEVAEEVNNDKRRAERTLSHEEPNEQKYWFRTLRSRKKSRNQK